MKGIRNIEQSGSMETVRGYRGAWGNYCECTDGPASPPLDDMWLSLGSGKEELVWQPYFVLSAAGA